MGYLVVMKFAILSSAVMMNMSVKSMQNRIPTTMPMAASNFSDAMFHSLQKKVDEIHPRDDFITIRRAIVDDVDGAGLLAAIGSALLGGFLHRSLGHLSRLLVEFAGPYNRRLD
jgi:hypothetical protein